MKTKNNISGFTLIELAIVLVIVGLLVSGVLMGQNLIRIATLNKIITQYDDFDRATRTFILKYDCLPGDCNRLTALGLDFGDLDGNGNKMVDNQNEMQDFWYSLSEAELIKEVVNHTLGFDVYACDNTPCLPKGFNSATEQQGGWGVFYGADPEITFPDAKPHHYFWLTHVIHLDAAIIGGATDAAVLFPEDAYYLDSKIDDGMPFSGIVMAAEDHASFLYGPREASAAPGGENNDTCVADDNTPNEYNVLNKNRTPENLCSLILQASF